jgi:hypothetical protein
MIHQYWRPLDTPFCRHCESIPMPEAEADGECDCGRRLEGWTYGDELRLRAGMVEGDVVAYILQQERKRARGSE